MYIFVLFFSTLSLEELTSGSGGGLLPIILSLLTSSQVTLDLASHQSALQLAGNLIAGKKNEPAHCKESDQPVHLCSLIRVFVGPIVCRP